MVLFGDLGREKIDEGDLELALPWFKTNQPVYLRLNLSITVTTGEGNETNNYKTNSKEGNKQLKVVGNGTSHRIFITLTLKGSLVKWI